MRTYLLTFAAAGLIAALTLSGCFVTTEEIGAKRIDCEYQCEECKGVKHKCSFGRDDETSGTEIQRP